MFLLFYFWVYWAKIQQINDNWKRYANLYVVKIVLNFELIINLFHIEPIGLLY